MSAPGSCHQLLISRAPRKRGYPRVHEKKKNRKTTYTPSQGHNAKQMRMMTFLDELTNDMNTYIYIYSLGFSTPSLSGTKKQKKNWGWHFFFVRVPSGNHLFLQNESPIYTWYLSPQNKLRGTPSTFHAQHDEHRGPVVAIHKNKNEKREKIMGDCCKNILAGYFLNLEFRSVRKL